MYIKALSALYRYQKSMFPGVMQKEDHPRPPGVRALMSAYAGRIAKKKRAVHLMSLAIDLGGEPENLRRTMSKAWTHRYPDGRGTVLWLTEKYIFGNVNASMSWTFTSKRYAD
ncbi:hypothetical protein BGZ76_010656 [Entomortierella beljakovae]|nr:hypothetical protein BGZ76_010656 [Entomortierella beljakovae]